MVNLNPLHEMGGQDLKENMAQGRCDKQQGGKYGNDIIMFIQCLVFYMFPEIMEHLKTQRGRFQSMV